MICEQYPPEAWTKVYNDGSSTNAIQDSGAGIAINFPSGSTETYSAATRIHYSNCKADSDALMKAISLAAYSQQKSAMAVCLTEALSSTSCNI